MDGVARFALSVAGLPEQTINDLEKSLPGFGRLVELAKKLEPVIQRNLPHLKAIEPDLPTIFNIIKQAWPDIVAVTPTIDELITFAKGNST